MSGFGRNGCRDLDWMGASNTRYMGGHYLDSHSIQKMSDVEDTATSVSFSYY